MSKNEVETSIAKQEIGLTKSEKNLIAELQRRKNTAKLHFYFEKKDGGVLKVVPKKIEGISPKVINEIIDAELCKITGIHDPYIAQMSLMETVQSMVLANGETALDAYAVNSLLCFLQEMQPQDAFESMLALRMVSLHYMGMRELTKANNSKSMDATNQHVSRVTKLTRLWNEAKDRWDKHRRTEDQKVVVEHIHMHEGSKAIIGPVTHGGGYKNQGGSSWKDVELNQNDQGISVRTGL